MSTYKGLTCILPLSCGFDSSVGKELHRHRRGCGFESCSEPEFFSGLCSSSATAALALMTVKIMDAEGARETAGEITLICVLHFEMGHTSAT